MNTLRFGYISPGDVHRVEGAFVMDSRSVESLTLMSRHLPGSLTVVAPDVEDVARLQPGMEPLPAGDAGIDVVVQPPVRDAVDGLGFDLVYGLHSTKSDHFTHGRTPFVLTSEQTFRMRIDLYRADVGRLRLARATLGLVPREAQLRGQVHRAASLQCNGPAAARSYGWMKRDSLRFHDSRIRAADVSRSASLRGWDGSGRLRLGFSGRLIAIKGPKYAVSVANRAAQRGLPVDMHIFGSGPLEKQLRSIAGPHVHFEGFKDFRTEWVPQVQESIDVMVLPHVQGDPSCTYFEALGSGAPILAFDNMTASHLVREHGVGWTAPQGDVDGMVDRIESLLNDPETLMSARDAGHRLMRKHDFDTTTCARAEHLAYQLG